MEEQNKFLKLLYLVAFVALAGVSCWATAESLHMLLESFPYAFCWVITIAFFIIASFGTKLIVDSLNQNVYVEKRGGETHLGYCHYVGLLVGMQYAHKYAHIFLPLCG